MKKEIKAFACGALVMGLVMGGTVAFAESTQMIEAIFGRVKLMVENEPVDKETLLYNGTTYVPLRAAAEMLGKEVTWDEATETAFINTPGTTAQLSEKEEEEPVETKEAVASYPEMNNVETLGANVEKDLKASLIYGDNSATYTYKYTDSEELEDDWLAYCKYLLNDVELECEKFVSDVTGDTVTNSFYNKEEDKNITVTMKKKDGQLVIVIDRYDTASAPAPAQTASNGGEVVITNEKDLPFKMEHIEYDININQPTNSGNIYLETFYRNNTNYTITSFTLKWYDTYDRLERTLNSIEDVAKGEKSVDFAGIGPKTGSSNDIEYRELVITYFNASGDEMVLTYDFQNKEYRLAEKI